ncbi:phosphorylase family protein [Gluconobacter roseus]|uniref:Nucleoside phosphorylase domain-containing protein n=1 Tax=Gluconobacter roseus NBRC 3990 TaxID=1307950 RepID=A0A4Y3M8G8_9PROT|nr:hypothetical protein [Gluconobacter roseus]KXV43371.1 hypothetical protein AD943_10560 [Gluconobacter roseus]GBR42287.1 hypothetical protein AA3990_0035 [Gluconobacter roseus NBRC 3990]GEB03571.1 hypothetical protein GRO01_11470 [Gluconobacter roseus NBRC 3990]GLP94026.1 hypothetical protein GCM10007871_20040 [Gluconobacter roseus NBRC 3990]
MLGVLAGLKQEARLIRRFLPNAPVALSNATPEGARRGVERLLKAGATELLSFGCAGSLSPDAAPGTVIVADHVRYEDRDISCDPGLSQVFGSAYARRGGILHSDVLVELGLEKAWYFSQTKCLAVDMESGVVADAGVPFAVLRVVCDDATRDLPPAVKTSVKDGAVYVPGLMGSLLRHPLQIGELIRLGKEAAIAQRAMTSFLQANPPQA